LGVSAGHCQRALVGDSGIIRTQMRKHNRSEMVTEHGTHCVIPPRKKLTITVAIWGSVIEKMTLLLLVNIHAFYVKI
jgi:hypothetical protein